jgi:two-component system, OmpR family, response regulator
MHPGDSALAPEILVVEDHDDSREMMREMLEHHRFRVSEAVAAREALDLAHAAAVRAIVTDVSFGGSDEDGVWLLEQLRAGGIDVPVIAVTGYADRQYNLTDAGFTAVLIKPIDIERFVSVVKTVVARRQ